MLLNFFINKKMIRENYGNISGSSESGSSSSGSGLNEQQVISLINSQTVQNFTNNFTSTDYNSFTTLNNWVNSKVNTIIENPVEEVYNRIRSELYDPQLTHTPISNICFNCKATSSKNPGTFNRSFNTNSLVFERKTVKFNETISMKRGDVAFVFYKTRFTNSGQSTPTEYIVNAMMVIICGYTASFTETEVTVPFNTSGNVTYFVANPFFQHYSFNFNAYDYQTSIELKTNAKCMLTTQYTDTINLNIDHTKINYYYLWSGSIDPSDTNYIDFLNVFTPDINNYNIFLSSACDSSVLDISKLSGQSLSDQSFYAIGQRNGIQDQVLNMFTNQNILNDLRKVSNLFQTYSLQSIYTRDGDVNFTPLHINNSGTAQHFNFTVLSEASVYIMFLNDLKSNIVGIDIVYCPVNTQIRYPTSNSGTITDSVAPFNPCNNIFKSYNDLYLSFAGAINLNRNLSFTINFMNIRNSELSTHLILMSKRLSFANLLNQIDHPIKMIRDTFFDFNYLNTNCYYLNLDNFINQKQGTIMNTAESDNIRISFE